MYPPVHLRIAGTANLTPFCQVQASACSQLHSSSNSCQNRVWGRAYQSFYQCRWYCCAVHILCWLGHSFPKFLKGLYGNQKVQHAVMQREQTLFARSDSSRYAGSCGCHLLVRVEPVLVKLFKD